MKKQFIFSMVTIVAVLMMVSCKKYEAKTANLNDQNDSLNYALGYANGDAIKNYYMADVKSEDGAIKAFIEALDKAYKNDATPDELYQLGLNIGSSLKQQQKDGLMGDPDLKFDYKLVKQGLENGLQSTVEGWSATDAQNYIQATMMQIQQEKLQAEQPVEEEVIIEENIVE